jgi:hypothetical protein
MKNSRKTLLAGLIVAMVGLSGAAQATTVLGGVYNEISEDVGLSALENSVGLSASSNVPEAPSWALMMLGFAGIALTTGNRQAKKRREAIANF